MGWRNGLGKLKIEGKYSLWRIINQSCRGRSFFTSLKNPDLKWQSSFSWHDQKSWYGTSNFDAQQIIGFSKLHTIKSG